MMELLQVSFEVVLELLFQIPMPWRFLLVLSVTLFGIPWLILRGLPWILTKFSQATLLLVHYLAIFLLFPESLISQYIRKKGCQPPIILYFIGSSLSLIVNLFNLIYQAFYTVLKYALKRQWILNKRQLLTLSVVFSIVWFIKPSMQQSSTHKPSLPSNTNGSSTNSYPSFVIQAGDGYANLRSRPSTFETEILAKIPNGTPVTILEQETNSSNQLWYKVQINGSEVWIGWIYSGLIEQR
ncbi:MAG: SH3 domain-containing protein [Coleofasciculus sp. A1-SPW-01]|uniref:SH3 domain-containing protein n=1 Tax=Coleofasciculus sp. A1-SPW-01 TaxID=3070819 RepID=UPI0032FB146D